MRQNFNGTEYEIEPRAALRKADLSGADLYKANLCGADLRGANLLEANLREANLEGCICLSSTATRSLSIVPEGVLIVYKQAEEGIVTLRIDAQVARSNATGRKCRAQSAFVLETPNHLPARSRYTKEFLYIEGQTVVCDTWEPDRWKECAGGIHFFITREEAEAYSF